MTDDFTVLDATKRYAQFIAASFALGFGHGALLQQPRDLLEAYLTIGTSFVLTYSATSNDMRAIREYQLQSNLFSGAIIKTQVALSYGRGISSCFSILSYSFGTTLGLYLKNSETIDSLVN